LIHQSKRQPNESSSAYGQHIKDDLPNSFYFADVDGVVFRLSTKILRVLEHKFPGRPMKESEYKILSIIANALDGIVPARTIHPDSGVFVVHAEPPWKTAMIREVRSMESFVLSGPELASFESGSVVNLW